MRSTDVFRNHGEAKRSGLLTGIANWGPLLLPPLLWAGNFVIGRYIRHDIPPMTLAFTRHLIAFLCLLPFCYRPMRQYFAQYRALRWHLIGTALTGLAGFNLCVYVGLQSTVASNGLLLNSTIPVLIVILATMLYGHKLRINQAAGLIISCVGVLTIILHGDFSRLIALQFSHGDLIVFLGMICFTFYTLWLRYIPAEVNRLGLFGFQLLIAAIFLAPFFAWEYASGLRVIWTTGSVSAMLYVAIAASLAATFLYMTGVARIGSARAGIYIHLIPLYGVLLSTVFLGETIHYYHAAGLAAILTGLTAYNWDQISASLIKRANPV